MCLAKSASNAEASSPVVDKLAITSNYLFSVLLLLFTVSTQLLIYRLLCAENAFDSLRGHCGFDRHAPATASDILGQISRLRY
jgi:hypothetical protein